MSSFQYQVLRSTDLVSWSVLASVTMPVTDTYTYEDTSPPNAQAFYRAAWVPDPGE